MAEKPVRKKVAKKTTRKVTKKSTTTRSTVKTMTRKAPTPIANEIAVSRRSNKLLLIAGVLFLLVIGVSAGIGFSDKGSIVVSETVSKVREEATPEEQKKIDTIGVQKKKSIPRGGLIPVDEPVPEPKSKEVETETSSSTDETATSTEVVAGAEDNTEENGEVTDEGAGEETTDSSNGDSVPVEETTETTEEESVTEAVL